jgi:hypothetical protein
MELLPDEVVISYLDGTCVILTNLRVMKEARYLYQSIRLENVVYIGIVRRPRPIIIKIALWICAMLIGGGWLVNYDVDWMQGLKSGIILSCFVLVIAGLIYFFWLDSVLTISSSGGNICGQSDNCDYFIQAVEAAIQEIKSKTISA